MDWVLRSIKTKLTLGIISAVVVLLAALLGMSYISIKNYSLNKALELSATILNDTDSKIRRFFLEIDYLADSLKRNSSVYNIRLDQMKELFISTVYARNKYLRAIYLGTSEGEMYEWGVGEGFINNMPTFPDGYDPRVRPWYKAALNADGFAVSEPYIYASINALGITCVVPVHDSEDKFIGVLGLDIILRELANIIKYLQIQKQGKVILLNQNFEILADQFNEYTENITQLKKFEHAELIDNSKGYFITDIKNQKMLTSYKNIESTGWILLVAIPYHMITEFSSRTLTIILLFEIFLMFLLLAILTILLHKIITEPLGKILGVMKEIECGNVDARIVIKGNDEFSSIGRLFNKLEDIRQEYNTRMKEEVKNRTKEITELQNENTRLRIIEEKKRIFGNLHDSLGAGLTNIFISNNVAKKRLANNDKLLSEMLDRIEKNTKQGINDLKEIIFAPETGDRTIVGFAMLIGLNIRERLKLKNINFHYTTNNNKKINNMARSLRFEIEKLLQEIVSNILKYAEAENVYLDIYIDSTNLKINLRDDGIGFEYIKEKETGFGINGIIGRIKRMYGEVEIASAPGEGVAFIISIPNEQRELQKSVTFEIPT